METPRPPTDRQRRLLTVIPAVGFFAVAAATLAILVGPSVVGSVRLPARTASAAAAMTTHVALDIMPSKPGGPAENWPAYIPSTSLTVPAHSLVTVTIRNFDLGDATMPDNAPLLTVQGTVAGVASVDGVPYAKLGSQKVAHTFTIPRLGLNVPIPGDAATGQNSLTVTFRFRTGAAGTYTFQCFAPCGTGVNGFSGPMASMAYMQGTLTVEG
jgi:hypothetical protein